MDEVDVKGSVDFSGWRERKGCRIMLIFVHGKYRYTSGIATA